MMENLFKSKKINSFLLTMIMIMSLFFFIVVSGCSESSDKEGERIYTKIIYRPYVTSKPNGSNKTYEELISENLLELSSDILTRLVGNYGIGEVSVKDGDSTTTVSPNINSVDYKSIFAINGSLSNEAKAGFALDMSKLTHNYFDRANKIFVISNNSNIDASAVMYDTENSKYVAQTDLIMISSSGGEFASGSDLQPNAVYKLKGGSEITYVFVGGYIGSNSSQNTFNNEGEAKTLLSNLLKTDFNSIQKKFDANETVVENGRPHDITFSSWKMSLTESEFSSVSDAEDFLAKYKEKHMASLAVEIADAILTRSFTSTDDFPSNEDISYSNYTEYKSMYEKASSFKVNLTNKTLPSKEKYLLREYTFDSEKSVTDKVAYLTYAIKYIDHLGLLSSEKDVLSYVISTGFAGDGVLDLEAVKNLISQTVSNYTANPILEYITLDKIPIDDVEIKGYLQSIVFMSEAEYDMGNASVCFNLQPKNDDFEFNYSMGVRNSEGFYPEVVEVDIEEGEWTFYLEPPKEGSKIDKFVDNLPSSKLVEDTISNEISQYFIDSKESKLNSLIGYYWCFNDTEASFVECAFATPDMFYLTEFKKISLFIE